MFKGFSKSNNFKTFPSLNFQVNNEVYGFSGCISWLDPTSGLNTQTDLAAVSSWQDKINGIIFSQSTAGAQPRFIAADANFGNKPTVNFNTTGKGLICSNGIVYDKNYTIAIVYLYTSDATGTSWNSRIISDNDLTSPRTNGAGYFWNANNNGAIRNQTGFYTGGANNVVSSSTLYNTNAYITIANKNLWIANNSSVAMSIGSTSIIPSFQFNAIGAAFANFSGIFTIAEILIYKQTLNLQDASMLSDRLNTKYAIY